jgi:hypothetical protein
MKKKSMMETPKIFSFIRIVGICILILFVWRMIIAVKRKLFGKQKIGSTINGPVRSDSETILLVPTYDKRNPCSIDALATFLGQSFARSAIPTFVFARIPFPRTLWKETHDAVQLWEDSVRNKIAENYAYFKKIANLPNPTPKEILGLQNNIRFEESRDIWSFGEYSDTYSGVRPWWKSTKEKYVYCIHPFVELGLNWDDHLSKSFEKRGKKTVLSPTTTKIDDGWHSFSFPKIHDLGDGQTMTVRRSKFILPDNSISNQPSSVAFYDDIFGHSSVIKTIFNEASKIADKRRNRITYALLTYVLIQKKIWPFCPSSPIGLDFFEHEKDFSIIGTNSEWKMCLSKCKEKEKSKKWTDLLCGISWKATEQEALAKYGTRSLMHWDRLFDSDHENNENDEYGDNDVPDFENKEEEDGKKDVCAPEMEIPTFEEPSPWDIGRLESKIANEWPLVPETEKIGIPIEPCKQCGIKTGPVDLQIEANALAAERSSLNGKSMQNVASVVEKKSGTRVQRPTSRYHLPPTIPRNGFVVCDVDHAI